MALRNAFAKLVTESVEGALEAIFARMDDRMARQAIMEQPRAVQYARTVSDAMRVNVENTVPVTASVYPGNSSTTTLQGAALSPGLFSATAVFMVDEREQQRLQTEINFNTVRNGRWVIS